MLILNRYQYKQRKRLKKSIFFFMFFITLSTHAENSINFPLLTSSSIHPANMTPLNGPLQETGEVFVFVSSSMPHASLVQWFSQANQLGAALVLRGLVNNSLPDTKAWLKQLLNDQGGIEINPVAFEVYGITEVPAVVVTSGPITCSSDCSASPFDVVTGNSSLFEALKAIVKQGEVGKTIAQERLARIKEAM
jgi:conjugal transfer pilus assembly protein TrbC